MTDGHFGKRLVFLMIVFPLSLFLCACAHNNDILWAPSGNESSNAAGTSYDNTMSKQPSRAAPASATLLRDTPPSTISSSDSADAATQADGDEFSPADTALTMYKAILQSQAEFVDSLDGKKLTMETLNQTINPELIVTATDFTVVDLDHDGISEMVLSVYANNNIYGTEVLKYLDGAVYGYCFSIRQLGNLKSDGTFSFSAGASDHGFGTVRFHENSTTTEKIAYCKSSNNDYGDTIVLYFVHGQSVSADAYQVASDEQYAKENAIWYELSEYNIERMLTASDGAQ